MDSRHRIVTVLPSKYKKSHSPSEQESALCSDFCSLDRAVVASRVRSVIGLHLFRATPATNTCLIQPPQPPNGPTIANGCGWGNHLPRSAEKEREPKPFTGVSTHQKCCIASRNRKLPNREISLQHGNVSFLPNKAIFDP